MKKPNKYIYAKDSHWPKVLRDLLAEKKDVVQETKRWYQSFRNSAYGYLAGSLMLVFAILWLVVQLAESSMEVGNFIWGLGIMYLLWRGARYCWRNYTEQRELRDIWYKRWYTLITPVEQWDQYIYPFLDADKWGYVDEKGTFLIQPKFQVVREFRNGKAIVQYQGRNVLLDRTGHMRTILDKDFEQVRKEVYEDLWVFEYKTEKEEAFIE